MPVLDAKALKTDPQGLEFLRDILRPAGDAAGKTVAPAPRATLRPRSRKASESNVAATLSR